MAHQVARVINLCEEANETEHLGIITYFRIYKVI